MFRKLEAMTPRGPRKFHNKKPAVIEAMRFNGYDDYRPIFHWMRDCGDTWALANEVYYHHPIMLIHDSQGAMAANPGDWIVRVPKGEFFPVPPEVFEAVYKEDE